MIKAVLVVKDKEPQVVTIEKGLNSYYKVLEDNLSDFEREMNPIVDSVDFFGVDVPMVSGMVESYSACHPYERNRSWHGPALFTEYNDEGETVSLSERNIKYLLEMYSLNNTPKSSSKYINEFLEKYAKPVIHNVTIDEHFATMNTMDAVDVILNETRPEGILEIEETFKYLEQVSKHTGEDLESLLTRFLKDLNVQVFKIQLEQHPFLSMFK